nr:hypothetical protein [uncultured Cohaesibacter sp.]
MNEKTEGKAVIFADLTFATPTGAQIIEFAKNTPEDMMQMEAYAHAAAESAGVDVEVIMNLTGEDFWKAVNMGERLFTKPKRLGIPDQSVPSGKPAS